MSELKQVLASVKDGTLSVEDALLKIKTQPFEDIGFAKKCQNVCFQKKPLPHSPISSYAF